MPGYDSFCCFRTANSSQAKRVLWELNNLCNLKCKYCHTMTDEKSDGIPLEQIKRFYPFLKERQISDIIFSGGEPLLRPDIFEILTSAKEAGFSIDLCTNGTLIGKKEAAKLKGILSEISISIAGSFPFVQDFVLDVESHLNVLGGISNLIDVGLKVHIISVVTDELFKYMEETVSLLSKLGIHSITFIGRMSTIRVKSPLSLTVGQKELREKILEIRETSSVPLNSKRLFFRPSIYKCSAGDSIFGIDARGNFLPCILLKRKSFSKNSRAWQKEFAENRTISCNGCENIYNCSGGCPGASCLYDNTIRVDLLCSTAHANR